LLSVSYFCSPSVAINIIDSASSFCPPVLAAGKKNENSHMRKRVAVFSEQGGKGWCDHSESSAGTGKAGLGGNFATTSNDQD